MIGEDERDLLHAAQVAVGMLGVVTELELEVALAYRQRERVENANWADVLEHFEERARTNRPYSFFWMPSERSAALYGLAAPEVSQPDRCYVKIYDDVHHSVPGSD